jgi:hypothetical protein
VNGPGRPPPPPPASTPGRRNRLNQLDCSDLGNASPSSEVPPLDWDPERHTSL